MHDGLTCWSPVRTERLFHLDESANSAIAKTPAAEDVHVQQPWPTAQTVRKDVPYTKSFLPVTSREARHQPLLVNPAESVISECRPRTQVLSQA